MRCPPIEVRLSLFIFPSASSVVSFFLLFAILFGPSLDLAVIEAAPPEFHLATFRADVTPPIGHPLLAGLVPDAKEIADPLSAIGIVLVGVDRPIVIVAVDWCEIRGAAHDRWRGVLADAAGTTPERVLLSSVHQHDAPLFDLRAEEILREHKLAAPIGDPAFHEQCVHRVAAALRKSLAKPQPITHIGIGQARVKEVASNRRYNGRDGQLRFDRTSAAKDPWMREQPEGTIDPRLKTLSFWDGERPVAALSAYATHPMSYYRTGKVSADFPGLARHRREQDDPAVAQIYLSGCSGNVTAGKYNDGSPVNRAILADRLYRATREAWTETKRYPLETVAFRSAPLRLNPREDRGYTREEQLAQLVPTARANRQVMAALGLSWRERARRPIDVPVVDFGKAKLLLLPGESYVEYQLMAQKIRPDAFVVVAGYGECCPGYVPTEQAWRERDTNLDPGDWCWVAPGAEAVMHAAIREALHGSQRDEEENKPPRHGDTEKQQK